MERFSTLRSKDGAHPVSAGGPARRSSPVLEPVQAPWIRPGVVVHDPAHRVEPLLERFALDLKERGFNIVGFIQRKNGSSIGSGCSGEITYLDIHSGERIAADRDAAARLLRRAMREDADLLMVSRFSACVEATDNAHLPVTPDGRRGLPILTSIAGHCIHKWHSYIRHDGTMLAPDMASLWNWWGPERLYRDLALSVVDGEVFRIVCGQRWIMVEGESGVGLAPLPRHSRDLLPRLPLMERQGLRALADLVTSWDPMETALGLAAVNAHCNRADLPAAPGNGVRAFRRIAVRTVVVGAFPGVDEILPGANMVEADPRPGEYPVSALDTLLPGCLGAVVNASTLVNRSLPRLMRLAQGRPFGLIGPATPLSARLHSYGVHLLGGLVVSDADGLAAALKAGASAREFGRFGRYVHLSAFPACEAA